MSSAANQAPVQEVVKQEPQSQPSVLAHEHQHSNGIIQKLPQPAASVATLAANMPPPSAAFAAAAAFLKRKAETPVEDPAARQKELAALQEARQREQAAQLELKRRFAQQHYVDKSRAIQPDYQTPFSSQQDILNRLLSYHVLYQAPEASKVSEDWKAEYAKKALEISTRIHKMKEPFERHVIRPAYSSQEEGILLNKLQYFDDKIELDHLKVKLGLLKTAPAALPAAPRPGSNPLPVSSGQGQLVRTATSAVSTPQTRAAAPVTPAVPQRPGALSTTKPSGVFSPPAVPPVKKPQPYVPQTQPSPQPLPQPSPAVHKHPPTPTAVPTPATVAAHSNAIAALAAMGSVALPPTGTASSHPLPASTTTTKQPLHQHPHAVVPKLPGGVPEPSTTGVQTSTVIPTLPMS